MPNKMQDIELHSGRMSVFDQQTFQSFNHSFMKICRAHYVKHVESQGLEAVARWSVIGKVASF